MHTRLQASLPEELYRQLPTNCQLWIATHSIGMTRRAMDLHRASPSEVVFLDFGDRDFDYPQEMTPASVDRTFWKRVFGVALDDIAELVAPSEVVFCEGRKEDGRVKRNPSFDATVYRTIFSPGHPDTEFVPLGGTADVEKDAILVGGVLDRLFSSIKMWSVFDKDDRSPAEIADLKNEGIKVLRRRDLENYLWDDEVLTKLCAVHNRESAAAVLIAKKQSLLGEAEANGKPANDIKWISGRLYNETKGLLSLTGCGNNAVAFARDSLAPLITSGMAVYTELEEDVFSL